MAKRPEKKRPFKKRPKRKPRRSKKAAPSDSGFGASQAVPWILLVLSLILSLVRISAREHYELRVVSSVFLFFVVLAWVIVQFGDRLSLFGTAPAEDEQDEQDEQDEDDKETEREEDELVHSPPTDPRRRRWILVGAAVLLGAQFLIPLRFYLGDDPFDERFAWRMFSATRVYQCRLTATEENDGVRAPVNLRQTIHVAWVNTMRRNREAVLERYLDWRCDEGAHAPEVRNVCRTPEGNTVPETRLQMDCRTGDIDRNEP